MEKRTNEIYEHIVNQGLSLSKLSGDFEAINMMVNAGLPATIIQRVLSKPQKTRSSDWK